MARDRQALIHELTDEEGTEEGRFTDLEPAEEYPSLLPSPVKVNGITITPLRGFHEIGKEAEDMANCVLSYSEEARVGALCLFRLESRAGRSTLGLQVDGDGPNLEVSVFQHRGPQHHHVDAPPPISHAKVVSRLVTALNGYDGEPAGSDWRDRLSEARRAHAFRAALRPSEQELSPTRQRRLAAFDLSQLGFLMNRKQRGLDLDGFQRWADGLLEVHTSSQDRDG